MTSNDMRTISFNPRNKRQILHIEAQGCIVNIQGGLSDSSGNPVTRVDVKCDDFSGERWHMPDLTNAVQEEYKRDHPDRPRQYIGLRVMPYTPPTVATPLRGHVEILFAERHDGENHGYWHVKTFTVEIDGNTPPAAIPAAIHSAAAALINVSESVAFWHVLTYTLVKPEAAADQE